MTAPGSIELRWGAISAVVDPVGARIAQVRTPPLGDWFLPSATPDTTAEVSFHRGARAGWDECFPSIEAADGIEDHGSLWHRRWRVAFASADRARLVLDDLALPFRAEREIAVGHRGVVSTLTVASRGADAMPYVYSAHPMFAWSTTVAVEVPGGREVVTGFGAGPSWTAGRAGMRLEPPREGPHGCVKYFVRWSGSAELQRDGGALRISADPAELPWLGVCVNRLGWPEPERDQHWIALEPCTAPSEAPSRSTGTLAPGATRRFRITVTPIHTPHAPTRATTKEVSRVR